MESSRFDESGSRHVLSREWTTVRLNRPNKLWGSNGVTFGPDGRLYVAQFLAGQISAVDIASGEVEVVVPLDSPVQAPDDLAFGTDGSLYIADLTPGKVWRRSPEGAYTLVSDSMKAPNGITCVGDRLFVNEMCSGGRLVELFPQGGEPAVLTGGLAWGNAMQLGPDGLLYYPHMITNEVWRISPEGGEPELVAQDVHEPVAVRFDRAGVLMVLSRGVAGIVTRIDLAAGTRSTLTTGIAGMDNAAFDQENRMLVSSYASGGVTEVDFDARARPLVARGLNGPFGVTADAQGKVYAADHFRLAASGVSGGLEAGGALIPDMGGFVHGVAADGGVLHLTAQLGDVRTYDPEKNTAHVRATGLSGPTGIAAGQDGSLVVAETGAGRVLRIGAADDLTVLAEGLEHPVDVALDCEGHCYVSDDRLGAVFRIADGGRERVADGLAAPQGLAVGGAELFVVETGHRRLLAVSLATGESRIEVEDLPVGLPPGITLTVPEPVPGAAAPPRRFAGLSANPDGSLLLSANGEGSVLRLSRARKTNEEAEGAVDSTV